MRNASGHQCKVKMRGSEKKVNEKTYDISSIKRVTKKFQQVSRCGRRKKVCCACKVDFLLIRPIVPFSGVAFAASITRFYILFKQTINMIESFALSPG